MKAKPKGKVLFCKMTLQKTKETNKIKKSIRLIKIVHSIVYKIIWILNIAAVVYKLYEKANSVVQKSKAGTAF